MDLEKVKRLSRSFDLNEFKDLQELNDREIKGKKSEKKERKKTRCKTSKTKERVLSSCLQVDSIGVPSPVSSSDFLPILNLKPHSFSVLDSASGSVSNQSSFILDETYDQECETSRNVMPEFINRDIILKTREVFREGIIEKSSQNNCELF